MTRFRPDRRSGFRASAALALESEKAISVSGSRQLLLKFSQYLEDKGPVAFVGQTQSDNVVYRDLINRAGIRIDS
jgi:hypothetical protein